MFCYFRSWTTLIPRNTPFLWTFCAKTVAISERGVSHGDCGGRDDDRRTAGGEGPQDRRARPRVQRCHGRRLHGAGVQPCGHARVDRRRGGSRRPGRRAARLHPHAADVDRVQRAEQGRPGLRDHVHLGGPGVRPAHRLGGRLGDRGRRHPGHGQPGAGRRAVRLPAVWRRRHRQQPDERLGAVRRRGVDHRDDLHLLPGHRGVREAPASAARRRDRHAAGVVGDGAHPRGHRPPPVQLP